MGTCSRRAIRVCSAPSRSRSCRDAFSARFEREARAVAALNHPNVCTLHDIGPNYLVMEMVEGPTLSEVIASRTLTPIEAVRIARQIAQALCAASRGSSIAI